MKKYEDFINENLPIKGKKFKKKKNEKSKKVKKYSDLLLPVQKRVIHDNSYYTKYGNNFSYYN